MTIASRTPEGFPSNCPLCGQPAAIEFSAPAQDAPCPHCGQLLWLSAQVVELLQQRRTAMFNTPLKSLTGNTPFDEFTGSSLDTVELVLELEEAFGIEFPPDDADAILTVNDLVRYLAQRRRSTGK